MNLSKILFVAVGLCSTSLVIAAEAKRPNIIFLMDDQHRADCLGVARISHHATELAGG